MPQSALPTELWVAPPTRMDEAQLKKEGVYQTFESLTQHTETPGCSLCMGNQARVKDNATVVSTTDIGHTRANKDFVNFGIGHL
jgi:aconitate hydratase 2/2-methylisocitrate dehydratase